ncbi:MAG: 5-formyltetrahydrofolate cyclo-ligase [Armatimonadota bacterium]|nr:5-formyltetrahydrofolate cyclo-ligase [Armatimonadota bacterium]MCX7777414.1 5-formyltetrahydrofolate cyclo-ligase [Armatimonadota bacterium]MDW8025083.1 5-formyltetrahydrofolate cyclo-ligase [Armatimonadota bacterium]
MADEHKRSKAHFRRLVKERFRTLSVGDRERLSKLICQRSLHLLRSIGAHTVMLYVPMHDEVDVEPLIRSLLGEGVRVCLPRIEKPLCKVTPRLISSFDEQIAIGTFGIREPKEECQVVPLDEIEVVIVPGRAFDEQCKRIGRGGGYYDRFLCELPETACSIGVAFEFQVFDSIPADENDISVDCIITERRIIFSERFVRRFGACISW